MLVCADKFRGTVTAREVGEAVAAGAPELDVVVQPLADGGEGTLEAFGGANRTTTVTGPLGEPVEADWALRGSRAVIEMARASGLLLAGGAEGNDPMEASTVGTGQLIATAAEAGADEILVGLGGSATTDGGLGALRAMAPLARYRGIRLEVACDVRTAFVDAAAVFGPQKGASPSQVKLLGRRLERLAQVYADEHGVDVRGIERAGAAGGLAGGLAAAGATLHDGFSLIAEAVELYDMIEAADLVVTGEGRLDESSFAGKVVGGVASLAAAAGVPVVAVVGQSALDDPPIPVIDLTERFGDRAMLDTAATIAEAAASFSDAPWR
ncbi:MAG: glycerate kinase [Acidimicrobiales bacterium]|nr:MAG: glycerate kinase [Acidimicrobiales bacterium]